MQPQVSPAAVVIVAFVFAGSLAMWVKLLPRLARREPLLNYDPRRPVPWNGLMLLAVVMVYLASMVVAARLAGLELGADSGPSTAAKTARAMLAMSFASLFTVGVALVILFGYLRATLADLGLPTRWVDVPGDVKLGLAGYFTMVAPVFAVQFLVTQLLEYEHPLIEMLIAEATPQFWIAAIFSAVVVAPVVEEFLFRLLLQGWLERVMALPRLSTTSETAEENSLGTSPQAEGPESMPAADVAEEGSAWQHASDTQRLSPYASPLAEDLLAAGKARSANHISWLPILLSSFPFAAMHFGQGPAPIPLFVLALGLGYIYQRTHRILPCMALHGLFNGYSLLVLGLSL